MLLNFTIVTRYSAWLIIPCIVVAFFYAFLLYRRDSKFEELSRWKIYLMSALRFLSVFFITFLLLSPLIKSFSSTIEKPIIVVAHDNSESVTINNDSTFYKNEYKTSLSKLINTLSEKYKVNTYSFGEKTIPADTFSFTEKQTDIAAVIRELQNRYINRNVGAMIIASDGIYNKGINPLYAARNIRFPLYTIALGDTGLQKDIVLSQVKYNKIAFLNNLFPIQAVVDIHELEGVTTQLRVYHNKQLVFSKEIQATSKKHHQTVDIELKAEKAGIQRYRLMLTPDSREISTKNNSKDIIIDIIDSKQKILILANSPHPDIGALRKTLKKNQNFMVDYYPADRFNQSLESYNLIVLHQLPSKIQLANHILSKLTTSTTPVLYIFGTQSNFNSINNLKTGINIKGFKNSFDETYAVTNKQFPLFELNDDINELIDKVPPLVSPFGDYQLNASAHILFFQKIRNITTAKPLLAFDVQNERKTGFIIGEGIWRWRMYDYLENGSHEVFDELINKMVQYLALKIRKDNFVINMQQVFHENEPVTIEAEVYNESYEPVNHAEVKIEITNAEGNTFPFIFDYDNVGGKNYTLNAGILPIGDYSYIASAKTGEKTYNKQGRFSIIPINIETINTIANHQLMYQLAKQNNGEMYTPTDLEKLIEQLAKKEDIVPIAHTQKKLQDLIHFRWLFFIFLLLISAEWFMRKYLGNY